MHANNLSVNTECLWRDTDSSTLSSFHFNPGYIYIRMYIQSCMLVCNVCTYVCTCILYVCILVILNILSDCTIDGTKDVIFLIDTFYNIGSYQFQMIREFVDNITISVKLNTPESSVGVILFDSYARILFNLEAHTSLSTLSPAINPGLPYNYYSYGRNTAAALNLLLSSAQSGSLGIRNETSRIAIVITGGQSNSIYSTQSAAAALHAANIFDVYAIGYNSADINELNTIASDLDFVYFTNFYNRYDVEELLMSVTDQLCSCKCPNIFIIIMISR